MNNNERNIDVLEHIINYYDEVLLLAIPLAIGVSFVIVERIN